MTILSVDLVNDSSDAPVSFEARPELGSWFPTHFVVIDAS